MTMETPHDYGIHMVVSIHFERWDFPVHKNHPAIKGYPHGHGKPLYVPIIHHMDNHTIPLPIPLPEIIWLLIIHIPSIWEIITLHIRWNMGSIGRGLPEPLPNGLRHLRPRRLPGHLPLRCGGHGWRGALPCHRLWSRHESRGNARFFLWRIEWMWNMDRIIDYSMFYSLVQ